MAGVSAVDQARAPASAPPGERGYIVRPGDSLWKIARDHGVPLTDVIRANPQFLHPDLIRPGQHVTIPAAGAGGGQAASYTIRPGDTLSGIAQRLGVSWRSIADANGIANPNLIHPGRTLSIPGGVAESGGTGGVAPSGGTDPASGGSRNPAQIAEQYLGRDASSLKVDRGDNLPMNANVPSNLCCANFVSAVLTEAGQLPASLHTDSVDQLDATLRERGWTPVAASEARAGDVVIIQGGGVSHTELIAGPGRMIGSNNVNPDNSQRVSYDNLDWALAKGAVILRAPDSVRAEPASAATGPEAAAPTGEGSQAQRIDQAIAYFESQGWSRAQAIGIVANLDAESGMDPGIRQHGGGPGYGLAQWEGPRQRDFAAWAGHDIRGSSFAEQLRFVQHELTHSEAAAGNALRRADDPREAAEIVTRLYERPADTAGEAARRGQRAVDIASR